IKELETYVLTQTETFKKNIEMLNQKLQNLKQIWDSMVDESEEKTRQLQSLENELNTLKDESLKYENLLKEKIEENQHLESELQKLDMEIQSKENEENNLKTSISSLENELNRKRIELQDLITKIKNLIEKFNFEISELNLKLKETISRLDEIKTSKEAIRKLIEKNIIRTPEFLIIDALKGKTEVSLDYLQKTTQSKLNVITTIVSKLQSKGIIDYNPNTQQIIVKTEIKY
ncbi:MAG: hypothetical protein ACTSYR_02225, partial [Candidatus Odinarchaeia archaeon]